MKGDDTTEYKYSGFVRMTIPFARLEFMVHPNMAWAERKMEEARLNEIESKSKSSSCFIATQVYGENAEETNLLRRFRDEKLLGTYLGRLLVAVYYRISPSIADFISDKPRLKKTIKRPLDIIVRKLNNK